MATKHMSGSCAPTAMPATNEVVETAPPASGWLQIAVTSPATKRKRRPAGTPDPDAEVVSLSPRTLLLESRTMPSGHRRKREAGKAAPPARKRVFVCPEPSCPHHHPSRALSGASAVKLHFRRQHVAQRQWSCCRCSRAYAVRSDYKAHLKICGGRRRTHLRYPCHCGRVFFRVDTFRYHQQTCTAIPPQPDVSPAPVCGALLSQPRQQATSPSLSSFASPSGGILIGTVIWPGAAAMRSRTVPTFDGFLPPCDTSLSGHNLELQLMPPSCHAAPRPLPPAPISRGDDAAIQLQLTMGPCSGDSRGGEEFRPSVLWRRAAVRHPAEGGGAAGTCSPSSSTAYGGLTGLQWAMSSCLPSWTAS